jgi:D-alanyl-D-alanine-carboxypeptidase/D-alanyl-D-alanine-endopeptidase
MVLQQGALLFEEQLPIYGMIRNHFIYLFSAVLLLLWTPYSPTAQNEPSEAYMRSILQERVEKDRKSVGIVVGIVSDEGVRIISYGKPDQQGSRSLDGETVFEIGSITKVFTTIYSPTWRQEEKQV